MDDSIEDDVPVEEPPMANDDPPRTRPVQISNPAYVRLSKASERTGISRAQIMDHLILRQNLKELIDLLKGDEVKRRHTGRRKQRFHS